jgi:hypothetical protein
MPATSGRQYRYMQMVAHGGHPKGGGGPSPAVAREFVDQTPPDKRRAFARAVGKQLRHRRR